MPWKCSICKKTIIGKNKTKGQVLSAIRRHRKKYHPKAFRASIRKGVATRRRNAKKRRRK